jgi:small GTP-binding protein
VHPLVSRKEPVFKVVFIGDEGVGKTSLITRYATSAFRTDYLPTIGANIVAKEVSVEGRIVTIIIWDIAGQEKFSVVRDKYYTGASLATVVYDVAASSTLKSVKAWLNDLNSYAPKRIPLILVGNKIDLPDRVVSKDEGEKLAKEIHAVFIETSAKTGENVRKLFEKLLGLLI